MIRRVGAILLLTLFLVQSSSKILIVSMWWARKDYIAENLCINKLKPYLHCNGKCYLFQKLKEAEQKQRDQMPQLKNFQEMVYTYSPVPKVVECIFCQDEGDESLFAEMTLLRSQISTTDQFIPPEV